jgi:hypothetical protein
MTERCLACGSSQLTDHVEQRPSVWEGRTGTVPLRFSTCNACGCQLVNAQQASANRSEILKFREEK